MRLRAAVLLAISLVLVCGAWLAAPYVGAAAFMLDLAGTAPTLRRLLPVRVSAVREDDVDVPARAGTIAARVYRPLSDPSRSIIVFPGVHAGGVDEPRLAAFSRRLAGTGAIVLSVPLPELRRYRLTPASTDAIEDAVAWMAANPALAPRGRIDVVGVSFAGGLALVAAGRPRISGKISSVFALGSHADLPRVMMYLCTGRLPDGRVQAPHDYGVVITLLAAIPKLVPADQIDRTRQGVLAFLDAESFSTMNAARAQTLLAEARRLTAEAPEPAHTLLTEVDRRDVAALGPKLIPYIEELGGAAAMSPDRSPASATPTFLLHGESDNLIPSSETTALAGYLREHGNTHVRMLLTPLLSHADLQQPHAVDAWRLIQFWEGVLREE